MDYLIVGVTFVIIMLVVIIFMLIIVILAITYGLRRTIDSAINDLINSENPNEDRPRPL